MCVVLVPPTCPSSMKSVLLISLIRYTFISLDFTLPTAMREAEEAILYTSLSGTYDGRYSILPMGYSGNEVAKLSRRKPSTCISL